MLLTSRDFRKVLKRITVRDSRAIQIVFDFLESKGVHFEHFDETELEKVKRALNEKNCIIWVNNHSTLKPVFINNYGRSYYGFESNDLSNAGFELYENMLDPDHFDDVHSTIAFFTKNPAGVQRMTYRVKNRDGIWKWTYALAKAINYDGIGKPEYVLAIVFDIEDMVDGVLERKLKASREDKNLKMKERYNKLTKREVEIMHLISSEFTSQEISEKLFIEPSTVDTHRKNIIRKLGVKSSLGLVRYALAFH